MKTKYRLVTEPVRGYKIEVKPWWSVFWFGYSGILPNSFSSQQYAEDKLKAHLSHSKKIVKTIDVF